QTAGAVLPNSAKIFRQFSLCGVRLASEADHGFPLFQGRRPSGRKKKIEDKKVGAFAEGPKFRERLVDPGRGDDLEVPFKDALKDLQFPVVVVDEADQWASIVLARG